MPVTIDSIFETADNTHTSGIGVIVVPQTTVPHRVKGNPWKVRSNHELIEGIWSPTAESEIVLAIGDQAFFLHGGLFKTSQAIRSAMTILSLEYDWDEEGAKPTDIETFNKAIGFVVDYSNWIVKNHEGVLPAPEIHIMKDGGILVQWISLSGKFLIVFQKNQDSRAYFYAERKHDKMPFKSAVTLGTPVDVDIARLISKLLR